MKWIIAITRTLHSLRIVPRFYFLLLILPFSSMAQTNISGEYTFGRQEMVAGFSFSPDGKFQFFHSYGAIDRTASGSFSVEGNVIKLKSDKVAGKDFTVVSQSKEGTGYIITVKDENSYLLSNLLCIYFLNGVHQGVLSDNSGEIRLDIPHCDKIYVRSNLFPDISTLVKDEGNDNNRFTLTINTSSIVQVSFKDIDLAIANDHTLTCKNNYFMALDNIQFIKH